MNSDSCYKCFVVSVKEIVAADRQVKYILNTLNGPFDTVHTNYFFLAVY